MLVEVEREINDEEAQNHVSNVYEKLVIEHLAKVASDLSPQAQADAACLALNRLPTKYVRNPVDWLFFNDAKELDRINRAVDMAVTNAVARVLDNPPLMETG